MKYYKVWSDPPDKGIGETRIKYVDTRNIARVPGVEVCNAPPDFNICFHKMWCKQRNEDEDDSDPVGWNDEDSDLSDDEENVSE